MINLLEGLYVLSALAWLIALIQFVRRRTPVARRFALLGVFGTVASVVLYVLLSPST